MSSLDSSPVSSSGSPDISSRSERASPESKHEQPVTSSEQINKKKARINYTNEQIQTLLKLFHENPYPESEMMENIAKDFGVPENKIKVRLFYHRCCLKHFI
ncbi:hypothetical protein DPMN_082493 [Dreissena polymorpha]|uniref:Homeobox domain-containing protein n=1 Tax=Dreissena polymorpha TaxID=45954 RepID=A0A9D3Y7P8_DREPO|nr:hypothetical protein DPMN_082493 [Dreissena polymorpha]